MVRVNAAAGTGKTTTLLHLTARCIDLQHETVCYLTFSRAAAADAKDCMRAFLEDDGMDGRVVASTMHSCAMRLLSDEPLDEQEIEDKRILDDIKLKKVIEENWGDAIDSYLKKAMEHVESSTSSKDAHKLDGKLRLL
jgi:superfamily I DNA/RNA helicase